MTGFASCRFEIGETAVTIAADSRHIPRAVEAIATTRAAIERQISADPFFLTTFDPYDPERATSAVTRRMCDAAASAGVGPMATVAGIVAQEALEAMTDDGCEHGWVDNGGDIALILDRETTVEVFHGQGRDSAFGLVVGPSDGIIGVCSSSATLGHSISLGAADVSVAVADSAPLADAIATAICNRVRTREDLATCFDEARLIDGFTGGIVVLGEDTALAGRVPRMVEVEHNHSKLTAHSRMASCVFTGGGAERSSAQQGVIP
ncbi:TPA: UPF0280 family protein [Thermoplasmata archaeon]|nr:UPF0280 family protein [Thermoplasmata archaeon]